MKEIASPKTQKPQRSIIFEDWLNTHTAFVMVKDIKPGHYPIYIWNDMGH